MPLTITGKIVAELFPCRHSRLIEYLTVITIVICAKEIGTPTLRLNKKSEIRIIVQYEWRPDSARCCMFAG